MRHVIKVLTIGYITFIYGIGIAWITKHFLGAGPLIALLIGFGLWAPFHVSWLGGKK